MSQPPNLYTQLTFHTSDGVDTVYPEKTEKLVEPDGSYEYFRPIAHNENRSIWWRNKTANGLMEAYKLNKPNVEYIFTSFPENYKLFEHVKFRGGKLRTDTYLFGHPASKRFRSVNEFIPHLRYLAGKDKVCTCTYCERGSHRAGTTVRRGTKKSDAIEARKTINIEERQKEQETAGWVLRKGEIVWVWVPDNREAEQDEGDPLIDYDGGIWMAGIVADRPNYTPPLEKDRSLFSGIETDDNLSPWQEIGDECYTIQLCSDSAPGEIMTNVRQHHVKPWLARPGCVEVSDHIEHPTIPIARKMAETFCLFERQSNDMAFKGAFVGAEKIFLHDPIRITHDSHEFEDVMVVEKIYIDKKKDELGKERSVFMFRGAQYTAYPSEGCTPLTVEEFLSLPFRMKRGSGFNQIIRWYRRTRPNQRAEISLATVLGRWYEPQAVYAWTGSTGFSGGNRTGDMALCGATVRRIVKNRKEGLGLHSLNGVDLETDVEVKIRPGLLKLDDAEDTPARDQVTPERGFKSVNLRIPSTTPGVSPQKEMELKRELNEEGSEEMVEEVEEVEEVEVELEPEVEMLEASAEDDEDYDEDEEEIDEFVAGRFDKYRRPGPEVLSQSPTKRPRR